MNVVLFACVHNAGRSQMAAAWFNSLSDPATARAISAGTQPARRVHPEVQRYLREHALAGRIEAPRLLTSELARTATLLVTMGCGESCPSVPGLERADWPVGDPKGQPPAVVDAIGRDVEARVTALLDQRGWRLPGQLARAQEADFPRRRES